IFPSRKKWCGQKEDRRLPKIPERNLTFQSPPFGIKSAMEERNLLRVNKKLLKAYQDRLKNQPLPPEVKKVLEEGPQDPRLFPEGSRPSFPRPPVPPTTPSEQ